jgi:hypothetical protein
MLHNEIIRKCFINADGTIEVDDVTQDEWTCTEELDVEKFARLIIQETMSICEDIGTSGDGQYCADAISKRLQ